MNICSMDERWFMVDETYLLNTFNSVVYELRIAKADLNNIRYPEIMEKYKVILTFQTIFSILINRFKRINILC